MQSWLTVSWKLNSFHKALDLSRGFMQYTPLARVHAFNAKLITYLMKAAASDYYWIPPLRPTNQELPPQQKQGLLREKALETQPVLEILWLHHEKGKVWWATKYNNKITLSPNIAIRLAFIYSLIHSYNNICSSIHNIPGSGKTWYGVMSVLPL